MDFKQCFNSIISFKLEDEVKRCKYINGNIEDNIHTDIHFNKEKKGY